MSKRHHSVFQLIFGNALAFCAKSDYFGATSSILVDRSCSSSTAIASFEALDVLLRLGKLRFAFSDCRASFS